MLAQPSAAMPKRKIDELSPFDPPAHVTLRHVVTNGHRERQSEWRSDLAILPAVSGDECARALERCGLVRCDEGAGVVWMEVGASFVYVPRCDSLPADTLVEILAASGLSTGDFIKQLDRWRPVSARTN